MAKEKILTNSQQHKKIANDREAAKTAQQKNPLPPRKHTDLKKGMRVWLVKTHEIHNTFVKLELTHVSNTIKEMRRSDEEVAQALEIGLKMMEMLGEVQQWESDVDTVYHIMR
mmetsp:Transcript_36971/g.92860  ORF Transcript_36971/g.92860 Transcript_36971/m.92860 type:complete len:113 (+) Transcript_36971:1471-1809(+)